jgi:hypothetical protein
MWVFNFNVRHYMTADGAMTGVSTAGAIAAGASLILAPHVTGVLAAAGMLSADGRCKTLDAATDGQGRTLVHLSAQPPSCFCHSKYTLNTP